MMASISLLLTKIHRALTKYLDYRLIFLMDLVVSFIASYIALFLAMLFSSSDAIDNTLQIIWIVTSVLASFVMFACVKSHRVIIRHSTLKDLHRLVVAVFGKEFVIALLVVISNKWIHHTAILLIADLLITFFMLFIVRLLMVSAYDVFEHNFKKSQELSKTLIFGVHNKSAAIVTRLLNSPHYQIVGFVVSKKVDSGITLYGHPTYYATSEDEFKSIARKLGITSIIFAKEEDLRDEKERIVDYALNCGVRIYLAPSIDESPDGNAKTSIRAVKIEDLLGRDEIFISLDRIKENFAGKTVMVTGAAGSIGSELCRQLAGFGVGKLILFDNAESPMHELRLSLEESYPNLDFAPVIGDVRYERRLDFAFRTFRPQVVFHAAAYKHVPLMEENPCEAVLVNVYGSSLVADKCIEYDVEKMVMISTDKAVNPTNVMGCTKRLAELYVQSLGKSVSEGRISGKTTFVTTRFGNVLGSHGSVIPRFMEQIEKGGPVTVTDPEITRFFMTIPEACRLVMEAATMADSNTIFVFNMGKSVKIDTMARRMIRLAGFEPDVDIPVVYTGLRPGEKLYEEVLADLEGTLPTSHDRIRIASVRDYDYGDATRFVERLRSYAVNVEIDDMVAYMKQIVPEYKSNNSVFEKFDK